MPKNNTKELGKYIQVMIRLCGMSPAEAEVAFGVPRSTLSQWTNGRGDPREFVHWLRGQYIALTTGCELDETIARRDTIHAAYDFLDTGDANFIGGM